jgi:hypothetical protein
MSVDTARCGSSCTVSALLKNLGGLVGGRAPSVVIFTMTDMASRQAVATCGTPVVPDVAYNATTTISCTFGDLGQHGNAVSVTAVADNSGRNPSGTPTPALGAVAFSCRLPVVTSSQAGWLAFPGGSFQADPKANIQLPGYSAAPFFWKSYVKAYERWLPVPRDAISPDGQHYAYADPPAASGQPKLGGVHVVDLASGADHLFRPAAENWAVLDFEAEGVYLAAQPSGPAPPKGLWLLDPSTQHLRQIETSHSWDYISGGGAWGTGDALSGHGPVGGSRLMRLDLTSGVIASWYKRTDIEFVVTGADSSGHPLLETSKTYANQMLLITAQNVAASLPPATGSLLPHLRDYIHPVSDAHGLWLGDTGGTVSLYTTAAGIQQVAHVGTGDVLVAGGCH